MSARPSLVVVVPPSHCRDFAATQMKQSSRAMDFFAAVTQIYCVGPPTSCVRITHTSRVSASTAAFSSPTQDVRNSGVVPCKIDAADDMLLGNMTDALKSAFEIMVVAALALPWIFVLIQMLSFGDDSSPVVTFKKIVPSEIWESTAASYIIVTLLIGLGYVAGSALSRISRDFFNDELGKPIPPEFYIRADVYRQYYCPPLPLQKIAVPHSDIPASAKFIDEICNSDPAEANSAVQEFFNLQENALLLQGQDKVVRLSQYFDQITVLSGGVLNGFILFAVCAFGLGANERARLQGKPKNSAGKNAKISALFNQYKPFLPAAIIAIYGVICIVHHIVPYFRKQNWGHNYWFADPPLAESVLLLLGFSGFYITLKAKTAKYYLRTFVVAAIATLVMLGGLWHTEIIYDRQVIFSQPNLSSSSGESAATGGADSSTSQSSTAPGAAKVIGSAASQTGGK